METSNQFNPRCVCGGSTENPNADCERCQMLAELARLKSEKEAAERERDEAKELADYHEKCGDELSDCLDNVCGQLEAARRFGIRTADLKAQLTAATSRAEALATGIESIHSGRIVLSQADNGEWGAVLGTRIVTGCETAAEAVLAAIDSLPAAEPDAGERVERPPMLLASIGDGSRDVWWTRQGDDLWESQRIFGVSTHAGSKSLIVDRTASDVAALKLYDHDLAASRPSEKE